MTNIWSFNQRPKNRKCANTILKPFVCRNETKKSGIETVTVKYELRWLLEQNSNEETSLQANIKLYDPHRCALTPYMYQLCRTEHKKWQRMENNEKLYGWSDMKSQKQFSNSNYLMQWQGIKMVTNLRPVCIYGVYLVELTFTRTKF